MISICISQIPLVSFALTQNNIAIIHSVTVTNNSETNYGELKVKISFDPEFADTIVEHILHLPAHKSWQKQDIQLSANSSFLCNLTEKITAKTIVQVLHNEEVIAENKQELDVLDYSQYWGNSFMSQYLAAFITPRHIALDPIIKRASELLARWTGSSSLSAYSFDVPNRPKMIVGAIYEAIAEQNITYCYPTTTLTEHGQKIRTCEELLSDKRGKRGCCLDMAILMCSCLEAVGMHPLLIMQDDHAFAGCWLVQDMFVDSVNDDPSLITKRSAEGINEIILIETTAANEGSRTPFDQAVTIANDKIKDIEKFSFILDVARARLMGIQPIPQRIYNGHEYEVVNPNPKRGPHPSPEDVGKTFIFKKDNGEVGRFDLWERRLLDLSARNNLLNTRFTRNTLRIMVPSLAEITQLLLKNREILILDRPEDWKTPIDSQDLGERISDNDAIIELLRKELTNDKLRSYQDSKTLSKSLTGLYRSARISIEECGANTLFLALGFLKWFEQGKSTPHFAPIVLYPIRLERKLANKGYYMVSRGEDAVLNETLFELLRQNYGIEIPDVTMAIQDERGVDIRYILAAVRKAVMEQDRWDVIEESTISIFDFNRFVIWNDLRTNRQSISAHPLINSLVEGKLNTSLINNNSVDIQNITSKDIVLPISADSSQFAAICEAASGKSFILHGPPGTGKSQTITNIISNALFRGKRVLFVAEKMAALEVVQRRLEAIGIAPFCMELHSNKTKKSVVMEQLKRAVEKTSQRGNDTFAKEAAHIDSLESELNAHIERLHRPNPCGLSIYDCFVRYSEIEAPANSIFRIDEEYIESLTPESLREHIELIESYESVATVVAEYNDLLREIDMLEYSPNVRANIEEIITDILNEIESVQTLSGAMASLFGLPAKNLSKEQYAALVEVAEFILEEECPVGLIASLNNNLITALRTLVRLQESIDIEKDALLTRYNRDILELDYTTLRRRWIEVSRKWFLARYFDQRAIITTLSSYTLNGVRIDEQEVSSLLNKLDTIHRRQDEFDKAFDNIDRSIGMKGIDIARINGYCDKLINIQPAVATLQQTSEPILEKIATLLSIGWPTFKERNGKLLSNYVIGYTDFIAKVSKLEELTAVSLTHNKHWLDDISHILMRWSANICNLRSKVAYNIVRKQVCDAGMNFVIKLFEGKNIPPYDISKAYHKSLYKHCANYYLSQDKELSLFQSILFEDKIKRFRRLCKEFEYTTRRELITQMMTIQPLIHAEASQGSDMNYLHKCIRNGCRGVSIRKLFDTVPDLISKVCPAMLMSPLSVSQYLGANWPQFDLVIFDEASQMPTCEAVAAISRGKSVVIVGDEQQLPPTSFFMADNFCEQYSENEDLESILEDCLALSMPQKHLLWHYRSKHESLITFSNYHFYGNTLLTFPSNDDMTTKVSFEYVEGVYERGAGRNNRAEAEAVVMDIKRRLSDPRTVSQSIGIVTFNVNQQSLIEDLLNDMLRKNPALEAIAVQMHEPIFIKNLENVQGDERDVIIFSMGHGRDKFGKVAMTFGPLNREGGERRLNVAVSRARHEMKVFSSLKADDIDLYRSNATGVKYLKSFLEYAERGNVGPMHIEYNLTEKSKDAFVESVATALKAKGYAVNTNIGSSKYRIDIGIIDPANPDHYLLGVLCDSYNYVASRSARDRDVTAPAILTDLGWRIYNIWSVEWWDTPDYVLNSIISQIDQACAD